MRARSTDGASRRNTPNAKIAILYQNDDYGKDYIAGLEAGLGANKSQIVATRGYNLTDASVAPQLLALRASGADTLMIFATPTHTIRTYATLRAIQWKPAQIYLNSVSATDTFMRHRRWRTREPRVRERVDLACSTSRTRRALTGPTTRA